jgi:dTDP-4-dehydrorhamnose reductase
MKIVLFGKNGQIGHEIFSLLQAHHDVSAFSSGQVDLAVPDQIRNAIRKEQPALIINAAAYTAVDKAEEEPDTAMQLNGIAPGIIAEETLQAKASLIHFSTDYVFSGNQRTPFSETDPTQPLGVYGKTKLEGERVIQESGCPYLILRTSSVYGMRGRNFFLTIARLAREKRELKIIDDQIMAPNWCHTLATATNDVIKKLFSNNSTLDNAMAELSGIYHLSCGGETSWFGFAKRIVESLHLDHSPRLIPVSSAEYASPTPRPNYSVLNGEKIRKVFGIQMPSWEKDFNDCLKAAPSTRISNG